MEAMEVMEATEAMEVMEATEAMEAMEAMDPGWYLLIGRNIHIDLAIAIHPLWNCNWYCWYHHCFHKF